VKQQNVKDVNKNEGNEKFIFCHKDSFKKKIPLEIDITQPRDKFWLKKQIKLLMLDCTGSAHHYKRNLPN